MRGVLNFLIVVLLFFSQSVQASPEDELVAEERGPTGFVSRLLNFLRPGEVRFDEGRRKILRGGVGLGAAAALTAGGGGFAASLFEAGRQRLPNALKRKLVALRRSNSSGVMTLDAENLKTYKKALMQALQDYPQAKDAILERIGRIDKVLKNKPLMRSILDTRPHPDTIGTDPFRLERLRRRISEEAVRAMEIEAMPSLEEAVLAARSFLDSMLLKKIAYQVRFTNPDRDEYVVVFSDSEAHLIRVYSALINTLLKRQEKRQIQNDFFSKWLPRLKFEVDLTLELYEKSQKHFIGACRSLL